MRMRPVIELYADNVDFDDDDNDVGGETCLNPQCDRVVDVVGVCWTCANGPYNPSQHGIDL